MSKSFKFPEDVAKLAVEKYNNIIKNREKVLEAFIAETGLFPTALVMIEKETENGTEIYYREKREEEK